MVSYYLTCRSLTYAQRSSKALETAKVKNTVSRTIKGMSKEGCGYAVIVRAGVLNEALSVLKTNSLLPKRVFAVYEDGKIVEVPL